MADNITIAGAIYAYDDLGGGVFIPRIKLGFGVDGSNVDASASNPLPTVQTGALPAGEAHVGEIGGAVATPSASFTRPADVTPYASGDLVADNTTAGSVTPLSWTAARVAAGSFLVRRARLRKS